MADEEMSKNFPRESYNDKKKAGIREEKKNQITKKGRQVINITYNPLILFGGAEGDRTPGLLNAIQARSQLRHSPTIYIYIFSKISYG
jgi:hypothetical protein